MWKKDSNEPQAPARTVGPDRSVSSVPVSRIGSAITFQGDVSGAEDLLIEGSLKGDVDLKKFTVTIGSPGNLKGNVAAETIVVEGQVAGHLTAANQIIVRATGTVEGNLTAPRVTLHDGCTFQGAIDMPQHSAAPAEETKAHSGNQKKGSQERDRAKEEGRGHKGARQASAQPA